jgi:hypothetical protein
MSEEDGSFSFKTGDSSLSKVDLLIKYYELDIEKVNKDNVELLKNLFHSCNVYIPNYKYAELSEESQALFKAKRVM